MAVKKKDELECISNWRLQRQIEFADRDDDVSVLRM